MSAAVLLIYYFIDHKLGIVVYWWMVLWRQLFIIYAIEVEDGRTNALNELVNYITLSSTIAAAVCTCHPPD